MKNKRLIKVVSIIAVLLFIAICTKFAANKFLMYDGDDLCDFLPTGDDKTVWDNRLSVQTVDGCNLLPVKIELETDNYTEFTKKLKNCYDESSYPNNFYYVMFLIFKTDDLNKAQIEELLSSLNVLYNDEENEKTPNTTLQKRNLMLQTRWYYETNHFIKAISTRITLLKYQVGDEL